jgi:hypothetical protein
MQKSRSRISLATFLIAAGRSGLRLVLERFFAINWSLPPMRAARSAPLTEVI